MTNTPPPAHDPEAPGPSRRDLLRTIGISAGVATVAGFWIDGFGAPWRRHFVEPTADGDAPKSMTPAQFDVLRAALARLVPGTGPADPGANEVNAAGYIDAIMSMSWFNSDVGGSILSGLDRLDERAKNMFQAERFTALDAQQQDEAIRVFETRPEGVEWLRTMISHTLEALFGDPVHGINPGEIGWRWAQHTPGTPRPS